MKKLFSSLVMGVALLLTGCGTQGVSAANHNVLHQTATKHKNKGITLSDMFYGPIHLGEAQDEVLRTLGKPTSVSEGYLSKLHGIVEQLSFDNKGILVQTDAHTGRVIMITQAESRTLPPYRTFGGIRLENTLSEVRKAYADVPAIYSHYPTSLSTDHVSGVTLSTTNHSAYIIMGIAENHITDIVVAYSAFFPLSLY